jgi:hypothetical protein
MEWTDENLSGVQNPGYDRQAVHFTLASRSIIVVAYKCSSRCHQDN